MIKLRPGEFFTKAVVRNGKRIDSLTLTTNQGRSISAGGDGGSKTTVLDNVKIESIGGQNDSPLNLIFICFTDLQ